MNKELREAVELFISQPMNNMLSRSQIMDVARIALPILEQRDRGDGEWIEWGGGLVAPVNGRVDVRYRNGKEEIGHKACDFSWRRGLGGVTIIAYRLVKS